MHRALAVVKTIGNHNHLMCDTELIYSKNYPTKLQNRKQNLFTAIDFTTQYTEYK